MGGVRCSGDVLLVKRCKVRIDGIINAQAGRHRYAGRCDDICQAGRIAGGWC